MKGYSSYMIGYICSSFRVEYGNANEAELQSEIGMVFGVEYFWIRFVNCNWFREQYARDSIAQRFAVGLYDVGVPFPVCACDEENSRKITKLCWCACVISYL